MSLAVHEPAKDACFGGHGWYASEMTEAQVAGLQQLCVACSDFYELTTGLPPGPSEAHGIYIALPETAAYDSKFLFSIFDSQNKLIGVLDTIRDYPEPEHWTIGLLMLLPERRRAGLGSQIVRELMRWSGAALVQAGVVERNAAALAFWRHMGFETVLKRESRDLTNHPISLLIMELRQS